MESLPDDVLHQILQIGTKTSRLDHIDLCSLAIVNSRFDGLTQDSSLWATLLSHDFPSPSKYIRSPSKAIYREQLENKRKLESSNQSFRQFMFPGRERPSLLPPTNSKWSRNARRPPSLLPPINSKWSRVAREPPSLLPINPNWNLSQSYLSRQVIRVDPRPQSTIVNPVPVIKNYWYGGPEAGPPPPPPYYADGSHPCLRHEHKHYYEKKPSNCFDKSSTSKVIPMSKSYVPMNRPPRRSMPRKI